MLFPSISSSSSSKNSRRTLEFGTEWGEGEIFDWCRVTFRDSRTINRLEIRISLNAVPHRFVVAYMQDGSIWRFDRRPWTPQSVLIPGPEEKSPHRAADEACLVTKADLLEIELSTRWEIRLDLPAEADIFLVISACFAIAQDNKARNYTLREYNCYFFSWTIVMLMVRHLIPFTVPSPTAVESRVTVRLTQISATISDGVVEALLDLGLSAVAAFDTATSKVFNQGLSQQELAVRALPAPVLHGVLRQCLKIQLRSGLKKKLDQQVYSQLEAQMVSVLRTILETGAAEENQDDAREHNRVADAVDYRLWLNQLPGDLRQPILDAILEVWWDNILETISQGYDDVQPDVVHQGFRRLPLSQRLQCRLLGKDMIQFSQIWNEALRAALPAARMAGYGQYRPGMTHGDMFDIVYRAGVVAALEAAKDIVRRTEPEFNDPARDEMWEYVWVVWDEAWESLRTATRNKIVDSIESTLADLVGWVAEDIVKELGDNDRQKVQATIRFKRRVPLRLHGEGEELSLESFQLKIEKFMQSVPGQTLDRRVNIEQAMSNAWDVSRKTYRPLHNVAP